MSPRPGRVSGQGQCPGGEGVLGGKIPQEKPQPPKKQSAQTRRSPTRIRRDPQATGRTRGQRTNASLVLRGVKIQRGICSAYWLKNSVPGAVSPQVGLEEQGGICRADRGLGSQGVLGRANGLCKRWRPGASRHALALILPWVGMWSAGLNGTQLVTIAVGLTTAILAPSGYWWLLCGCLGLSC